MKSKKQQARIGILGLLTLLRGPPRRRREEGSPDRRLATCPRAPRRPRRRSTANRSRRPSASWPTTSWKAADPPAAATSWRGCTSPTASSPSATSPGRRTAAGSSRSTSSASPPSAQDLGASRQGRQTVDLKCWDDYIAGSGVQEPSRGPRERRAGVRRLRHPGARVPVGRLQGHGPQGQGPA